MTVALEPKGPHLVESDLDSAQRMGVVLIAAQPNADVNVEVGRAAGEVLLECDRIAWVSGADALDTSAGIHRRPLLGLRHYGGGREKPKRLLPFQER